MFKKAVKSQSKLRMSIAGPSGSGKTYTALAIAGAMGRVAVIDTENASASKYADLFDFDVMELEAPYHPDRFIGAIAEAEHAGYDVVVIDSLSPAWSGTGGLLEVVDGIAKRMKTSNTFAAWKDATLVQNRLVEAIVRSKIHLIATMRSKTEYILENVNGKNIPRKVGMAPVQRDGFEYEFDIVAELNHDHDLMITKTRYAALDNAIVNRAGVDFGASLIKWLSEGEIATAAPATTTTEPPAAPAAKYPARPWDAETLRRYMTDKAASLGNGVEASPERRKAAVIALSAICGDNEDKRHAVTRYLFGNQSTKALTKGQVEAAIKWVGLDSAGLPNAHTISEVEAVAVAAGIEAGQLELLPEEVK